MSKLEAQIAAQGGSIHAHRKATRQMRWWYESLADFMIANPKANQEDAAHHFGRARSTISTIMQSDSFKAYMRQRRDEFASDLDSRVKGKLLQVVDGGLDIIIDKLDKKRDTIPLRDIQATTDSALKALGYGLEQGPSVTINNAPQTVVVPVSLQDLQDAQLALRAAQQRPMIDITPNPSKAFEPEPETVPNERD